MRVEKVTTKSQLLRWKFAIFAIFFASGLSVATWAARVPAIKIALGIDNLQVGLLLLGAGIGSLVGLSSAAFLIAKLGTRRAMPISIVTFAIGLIVIGVGTDMAHSYPVVLAGLFLFGIGNGSVDIMMNVEGAGIENHTGKTLLPMFHGLFSLGTVAGALFGALAIRLDYTVAAHATITAGLIALVAIVALTNVPRSAAEVADASTSNTRTTWRERLAPTIDAWKDPRTYGIGLVMLGMSFAEGGANDWLALAMVEDHGTTEALGALGLATFSVSMTVVRLFGGPLVDRFGRVAILRALAVSATAGMILFIWAPSIELIFVAAVLWGAGVSLGFPLGMSAAADDPTRAAARVSAVATIGYVAFLCGPPLLGLISEHIGLLNTLYILVALAIISGFASASARESKPVAGSVAGDAQSVAGEPTA